MRSYSLRREAGKLNPLDVGKEDTIKEWEKDMFSMQKFVDGWESDYTGDSDWDGGLDLGDTDERSESDDADEDMEVVEDGAADENGEWEDVEPVAKPNIIQKRLKGFSDELTKAMGKMMIRELRNPPVEK